MKYRLFILLAALSCAGCWSATGKIASSLADAQAELSDVRQGVQDARRAIVAAKTVIEPSSPAIGHLDVATEHLDAADGHCETLSKQIRRAQKEVPNTQDKRSEWASMLRLGLVTVAIGIVAFVAWRFGLFIVLRALFKKLAAVIATRFNGPGPPPADNGNHYRDIVDDAPPAPADRPSAKPP